MSKKNEFDTYNKLSCQLGDDYKFHCDRHQTQDQSDPEKIGTFNEIKISPKILHETILNNNVEDILKELYQINSIFVFYEPVECQRYDDILKCTPK